MFCCFPPFKKTDYVKFLVLDVACFQFGQADGSTFHLIKMGFTIFSASFFVGATCSKRLQAVEVGGCSNEGRIPFRSGLRV
jgi:hypothetical protein